MAKITVLGNALQFKSGIKEDDITMVMRSNPDVLVLRNEEQDEVFRVGFVPGAAGSITNYGICFDSVTASGELYITVPLEDASVSIDYIAEKYAIVLSKLTAIETAVETELPIIQDFIESAKESIEII